MVSMVSAAVSSQADSSQADSSQAEIKAQAAAGYFRAIALWLNQPLVDQGIYVQVQAGAAGCLDLVVEWERTPEPERLIRFLCHRVWQLNSPLIEGIQVAGRRRGSQKLAWQRRVRIATPALKTKTAQRRSQAALPPRLRGSARGSAPVSQLGLSRHLKTLRAFVLSGSAVAAFIMGCLMEVILSGSGPVLPSFSAQNQPPAIESQQTGVDFGEAAIETTQVIYDPAADRSSDRPSVVDAALEPVAVIPYHNAQSLDPDVTLLFGGDFPLEGLSDEVLSQQELPFEGIEEYQNVDVAMINLGTSLTDPATTLQEEYYHHTRPDVAELLKQGGVDIVNLSDANIMDYGEAGLTDTLYTLDRSGVYRVGAGRNEYEARRPEILDVKGERIAYLSYSQGGDLAAHQDRAGVNAQDRREIAEDIRALRDEVDWIVVNYRWQTDLAQAPSSWQINLARLAIDQGADLVVGYHPQQLQGAEVYKGRPIAYALGDFIFRVEPDESDPNAQPELETDQDTAVLKVSLRPEQMKVEFLPVQVRQSRPARVNGAEAKAIMTKIEQASSSFEQPFQSPLVIDRKSSTPPPAPVDPDSPFVQPDGADESLPTTAEPPTNTEGEWMLELEMPAEDLQDWGPKGTSDKFKPIPESSPETTRDPAEPATRPVRYENLSPQSKVNEKPLPLPEAMTEEAMTTPLPLDISGGQLDEVAINGSQPAESQPVAAETTSETAPEPALETNLDALPEPALAPSPEPSSEVVLPKPDQEKPEKEQPEQTAEPEEESAAEPEAAAEEEAAKEKAPEPEAAAEETEPEAVPTLDGPALAPEAVPTPPGIRPFSEPLVGPLSVLDAKTAERSQSGQSVKPQTNPQTSQESAGVESHRPGIKE